MLIIKKPIKYLNHRNEQVIVLVSFVEAIAKYVKVGHLRSVSTSDILRRMNKPDTDSNRRLFRHAVEYYQLVLGVCLISTPAGYCVAANKREQQMGVRHRRKEIENIKARAAELAAMNVQSSLDNWHTRNSL